MLHLAAGSHMDSWFFFFQAEDGIRDYKVTGVQTCALPILCKAKGAKRVIALKVSGAFHSPLMEPAANSFRVALERAPFTEAAFPIVANATAEAVKDPTRARRLLSDQLTSPVRWIECMQNAAKLAGDAAWFVEIGPGNVLAGLLKRIVGGANVVSLGSADEVSRFLDGGG